ncbi:MAG: class I SAM-dependent methyltransferase, partial [Candidatus Eremiobacteraeota bacterium]|nr:class I SAM-dependent methyltransferase [Candidatus Eremiobacteraeota bacterium]
MIFAHAALVDGLRSAGVLEPVAEKIAHFGAYLLDVNRNLNLTGADTPEELLPHLVDSLSVVPYLHGRYVDVGSGGGLPAIPAAIAAGLHLTMIEAITKKAVFLESALTHVGLNGRVVPDRAEGA